MYRLLVVLFCVFINFNFAFAQNDNGFQFHRAGKKRYIIPFTNYNNLIIIEAKLNGNNMNLLLDTGVDKTILFGIEGDEKEIKKNSEKILIKGVSGKKITYAYRNDNNRLKIDKLVNYTQDIYVIFDEDFNISDKIGYQIQGIIGYDFFEDHVVKIDYAKSRLKVYNTEKFSKSLKSYDKSKLFFYGNKPYLKTEIKQDNVFEEFTFLLDTGSGDAIWVKPQKNQKPPKRSFYDILGYGFADIITGVRSKASAFKLGKTIIDNPKIAYPDSLSYTGLEIIPKSGVIGSEIMRRFNWYIDYKNLMVYYKPNPYLNDLFNYDMSGLVLKYDGYQQITSYYNIFPGIKVKTDNKSPYFKSSEQNKALKVEIRPILKIGAIRPNSSAFEAGFIEGDEIKKINGKYSYRYDLDEIKKLFSSKEGLEIDIEILRNGFLYEKTLTLKSRFLE